MIGGLLLGGCAAKAEAPLLAPAAGKTDHAQEEGSEAEVAAL